MKRDFLLFTYLFIGCIVLIITSCEDDPTESCEQEEICEAKVVTACCTEDRCVYKWDGKEYPEEDIDQLADDLGCAAVSIKSTDYDSDMAAIINQLQILMDKAHAGIK